MDKYGILLEDGSNGSLDSTASNLVRLCASDANIWEDILEKPTSTNHSITVPPTYPIW